MAYQAIGLERGDLVFVPSFAWPSAANVACVMGALPVLVDVYPGTYNINPESLEERIRMAVGRNLGRLRLVVPVHQFGLPCDLERILGIAGAHDMEVVEDAACALGAVRSGVMAGCSGRLGIYSFHPRKSITTGEGGMIVTDDDNLAAACRAGRNHGQTAGFEFAFAGLNYRMTEMQGALGGVQMGKLKRLLERRRDIARLYLDRLAGCLALELPEWHDAHTWQTFMVVLREADRTRVIDRLRDDFGVQAGIGSVDAHSLDLYAKRAGWVSLPVSERLDRYGMALPLHVGLSDKDVVCCADALLEILA